MKSARRLAQPDRQAEVLMRCVCRRVYELVRDKYPDSVVASSRVPFPGKQLVRSIMGEVQRAEGLLLWLSTNASSPVSEQGTIA